MGVPRSSLGFPSIRPIQLIIFFVVVIGGSGLPITKFGVSIRDPGSRGQNPSVSGCFICCKQEALGPGSRWLFEYVGSSHH
jgi:hypothetical protein